MSDGENVYVSLGKGGVHSITLDGQKNWSVDVGKESKSIIALDKATGEVLWKQEAGMLELTYGTPRIVNPDEGDPELVISVPGEIWSLNPTTGKLKWYCESPMTGNVCPSVIVDGETIDSFGGYRASGSIAVKAGGKDDVSASHVTWTNRSSSYVATPLLHNDRFYWIDDIGEHIYVVTRRSGTIVYKPGESSVEFRDRHSQ